ncbi:VacJ family lipoprotein [Salinivibrio kushneri]|uniref:MlaA family lipoprotein n=1 Tax=Salinivibrio kushneri TaxID=1908198 RepID=UPI000988F4A8|nr:MlaA family lipoprotein [Salinivibrio kushneri]OOE47765.1 ABC transporter [Salinivibrio kushneri]OOE54031.1 ABC transporter [Salinivibrio kushneri]
MWKRLCLMVAVIGLLSGCVSRPPGAEPHPEDPLEGFNRAMWTVNYDYLDPYVARPVSIAYVDYVPSPVRTGISNFLGNLEEPASMLNSLIMLEGEKAATHFNRFWINTLFGLGGLIDIASAADIQKYDQREFGDAIGHYDVGTGAYIMLPGYGPTSVREGAGEVVDGLYPPLALLTLPQSVLKWMFDGMESRAALVSQESQLDNSPDPYAFARDAYLQNRRYRAKGDEALEQQPALDDEFLDDFIDDIDAAP